MKKQNRCPMCDDPSCKLTIKDFFNNEQTAKSGKRKTTPTRENKNGKK